MLATKEHLDFCMSVIEHGGRVVLEPTSVVTYLIPNRHNPVTPEDWPYFLVRWSPTWQRRSIARFHEKWGLAEEGYVERRQRMFGWRHDEGVAKAIARKVPLLGRTESGVFIGKNLLRPALRVASRALVAYEDLQRARRAGPRG